MRTDYSVWSFLSFTLLVVVHTGTVRAQSADPAPRTDEVTPAAASEPAAEPPVAAPQPEAPPAPVAPPILASAPPPRATGAPDVSVSAGTAAPVGATAPAPPRPGLAAALVGGPVLVDTRYRFEYIDQEGLAEKARASTLRAALGYETLPYHGLSVMGQLLAVAAVGPDDYRIPTSPDQNKMEYPVILDPLGPQVAQAFVRYANPWFNVKVGRQEVALNNGRFVSVSTWRQSHQTLDAAQGNITPMKDLAFSYTFVARLNRVVGIDASDGQLDMASHLMNASYKRTGLGSAAVYALLLDFDDATSLSTQTFGVRLEGPYSLNESWSLLYALEGARQRDAFSNPNQLAADYFLAEAGVAWKGFGLRAQYNQRGGESATNKLLHPLTNPWDGWTEKFVLTPDQGVRVLSASAGGPVPGVAGLSLTLSHFEYWAESAPAHYGREVDAGAEYRFVGLDKNWAAGFRFAYYMADTLMTQTLRTAFYTAYAF
jgi:hypothetical protein